MCAGGGEGKIRANPTAGGPGKPSDKPYCRLMGVVGDLDVFGFIFL